MHRTPRRLRWFAATMALAILLPQLRAVTHRHVGDCGCESETHIADHVGHSHPATCCTIAGTSHSHDVAITNGQGCDETGQPCSPTQDSEHDCGLCKILNQFAGTTVSILVWHQSEPFHFQSNDRSIGIPLAFVAFYQGRAPPHSSISF